MTIFRSSILHLDVTWVYKPILGKPWREKWGVADNDILIGIVARLHPLKAHEDFLKAASIFSVKNKNVKFVCVGEGSDKRIAELCAVSKHLNIEEQVIWAGRQTNMAEIYNAIDLLSLTSKSEGFPNVIIEGMSCGLPCVSTDVSDVKSIILEYGAVVPVGAPEALAKVWQLVLLKCQSETLDSLEIRTHMINSYSEKKMIDTSYAELFDSTSL